jgi:adenine specific DNA methylase Mod
MIIFEQQRLPISKKDMQWRKNNVDSACSHADEFSEEWYRMYKNYRLKNNQIDQSEYREYCDTLGLQTDEGKKFVEPFNKTHTIIDVLKGEENAMP